MASILQLPPPLELAIGLLSPAEQSHAQVSMRVLAAHLPAPCMVVMKEAGDITLKPDENDDGIRATSAYGEVRLERPMRLVPLSEALSTLINGILSATGQVVGESVAVSAPVQSQAQPALLDVLLRRNHPGPLEIVLASGCSLLVDDRYIVAHLSAPVGQLLPALIDESVLSIQPIAMEEFTRRTTKGNALHPVSVEQLCWALPAHGDGIPELERWHQDERARISLDTWPNLSAQPDAGSWLEILTRLHRHSMSISQLRHAAVDAGIPAARARHGISLLLTYRHARIALYSAARDSQVVSINPPKRTHNPPAGLLGRLRMRLRALAA